MFRNKRFMAASSTTRDARAILLRMARDQSRAERIRALKDAHPEITWDEIAAAVGVSPRAANAWAAHGGIAPRNAERLARFFDVGYRELYHGPEPASPDLIGALGGSQLDRIEGMVQEVLDRLPPPEDLASAIPLGPDAPGGAPAARRARRRRA